MKTSGIPRSARGRFFRVRRCTSAAAIAILAPAFTQPADDPVWTASYELSARVTHDSNVFLQDVGPSPLVAGAARPFVGSMVSTIAPRAACEFQPHKSFNVSGSYSPEIVVFHNAHTEDHVAHRGALRFHGTVGKVTWQMQNNLTWIDGKKEGLTFGAPGGAPAIGGIAIRDRREAVIYRNSFGAFHKHGRWFFRPAVSSYIHDFRTRVRDPAAFPNYQNYVDRNDFNAGLDAGHRVGADGHIFLACRFGWQHEPSLSPSSFDYSNNYRRLLLGFEGKLTDRIKLNLFIGPDWRDFNHMPPPGFDRTPLLLYIDGSANIKVTGADNIALTVRRFEQPAFGAPSAYEDITYSVQWKHRVNARWSAGAGLRAYGGVWEPPVMREDWIVTPSASLTFTHNSHLSVDLAWSRDVARSSIADKPGRDFTRTLLSLGARIVF